MPVPTTKHYIWIRYPREANSSIGYRFLARIMDYYNHPPNPQTQKMFLLLCKSVFFSLNLKTNDINPKILQQFYNKNGFPISLGDEAIQMKHEKWDGIQSVTILCEGPNNTKKIVSFIRDKGSRRIKFVQT